MRKPRKPKIRCNRREKFVLDKYVAMGFEPLRRGWPDFCFVRGKEVVFVEVKPYAVGDNPNGIANTRARLCSSTQRRMHEVLGMLGLTVVVEGVD